jgi:hypothetical protein
MKPWQTSLNKSTQQREKRKDKEGGLSLPSLSEKSKPKIQGVSVVKALKDFDHIF